MADRSRRLKPAALDADESSFAALQAISNYAPANPACEVEAIRAAHEALLRAQAALVQAEAALAAARDDIAAREWEFHNLMLRAKDQVMAQFGRNSSQVASLDPKKAPQPKPPQRSSRKQIRSR